MVRKFSEKNTELLIDSDSDSDSEDSYELIECDEDKRGLYNLASFNKTAEQIAYEVADVMGVEVLEFEADPTQIKNTKNQTKAYNFSISTLKFRKEFGFKFKDTVEGLATELKDRWDDMKKTNRSEAVDYE